MRGVYHKNYMKRYVITVTGKVQGVFFRDSARREALKLSLAGFVRNDPDGSVYIEAEGDEDALRQLLWWCSKGSDAAKVTNVEYTEQKPAGHQGFLVL